MKMVVSTLRSVLMPKASTRVVNPGRSRAISLSLFFVVMCAGLEPAEAAIIQVNGLGESIQAAIDIANDGDVIAITLGDADPRRCSCREGCPAVERSLI